MESIIPVLEDLWSCEHCGAKNLIRHALIVCASCAHRRDYQEQYRSNFVYTDDTRNLDPEDVCFTLMRQMSIDFAMDDLHLITHGDTTASSAYHALSESCASSIRSTTPVSIISQPQVSYLMTIMQLHPYRQICQQICIDEITTDRELFCLLQKQIVQNRSSLRTILSLKSVQGVHFTKFLRRAGVFVEIRSHSQCCNSSAHKRCECIPPASRVKPAPDAEYRCKAPDTPLCPPILSGELLHMLNSPECIDPHENYVLNQLPTCLRRDLEGIPDQPDEGWGIYFEEGLDFDRLAGAIVAIFLLASLLFAVLWSYFKMDVQGAFGVSSYVVTTFAMFTAWFVNRDGKMG